MQFYIAFKNLKLKIAYKCSKTSKKQNKLFKEDFDKTSKKKIIYGFPKIKSHDTLKEDKTIKKEEPKKTLNQDYFKTERSKTPSIFSPRNKLTEKKVRLKISQSKSKKDDSS